MHNIRATAEALQINQHGIILIVVEHEIWKHLVHKKQLGEGA